MSIKKVILAFLTIFTTLIFGGIIIGTASKSPPQKEEPAQQNLITQEVLGKEEEKEPEPNLPILEIFNQPVFISNKDNDFTKAVSGVKIPKGTKIKTETGGRAQVVFPNKSVARIDENSLIILENIEDKGVFRGKISIEAGRVWNNITLEKGTYESKTPVTLVTRGKIYSHEIDRGNKQDIVTVMDGKALVRCLNKLQELEIDSGKKGGFNCKKSIKPVSKELTEKELNDLWIKFNLDEDKKMAKPQSVLSTTATPSPSVSTHTFIDNPGIYSADSANCHTKGCTLKLKGIDLKNASKVDILDKENLIVSTATPTKVSSSELTVYFFDLPQGYYVARVKTQSGAFSNSVSMNVTE